MYWIYNVLLIFYWIGLIPVILYRLAFEDGFYERIKQSAGYMPASLLKKIEGRRAIWIHAASVGEIVATSPLVKEVKKEFPEAVVVVSVVTATGHAMAHRIIPDNMDTVRKMVSIHTDSRNSIDDKRFAEVNDLRFYLAKDSDDRKSLFTRLIDALNDGEYDLASQLQIEMNDKMEELEAKYANYAKNIF